MGQGMTTKDDSAPLGRAAALFLAVLDEMSPLYGQLDALSQRQAELIESEDHEPLLTLLQERQQLIDRLLGLKRRADALRRQWETEEGGSPRTDVMDRLRAMERMAASIDERDAVDRRALEGRRQSVMSELSGLGRARSAVTSYGGETKPSGPKFQDVEG
jgi:hypothetical protein